MNLALLTAGAFAGKTVAVKVLIGGPGESRPFSNLRGTPASFAVEIGGLFVGLMLTKMVTA